MSPDRLENLRRTIRECVRAAQDEGYQLTRRGMALGPNHCCLLGAVVVARGRVGDFDQVQVQDDGTTQVTGFYPEIAAQELGVTLEEADALETGYESDFTLPGDDP